MVKQQPPATAKKTSGGQKKTPAPAASATKKAGKVVVLVRHKKRLGSGAAVRLSVASIRRIALRGQLGTVNKQVEAYTNEFTDDLVRRILVEAEASAELDRRKIITRRDMDRAIEKVTGHRVYGDPNLKGFSKQRVPKKVVVVVKA